MAAAPEQAIQTGTLTFVIVPAETTASYSIDEVLFRDGNRLNTTVGKTSSVEGTLSFDPADPAGTASGEFTVNVSTLQSDSERRDGRLQEDWLESATFPQATFVIKQVRNFPADPTEGQAVSFQLVGDLKLKETTREVTWDATATATGDKLTGTATSQILLTDFNIPVPDIAGMLKVTDGATVTLDFTMQKQS